MSATYYHGVMMDVGWAESTKPNVDMDTKAVRLTEGL